MLLFIFDLQLFTKLFRSSSSSNITQICVQSRVLDIHTRPSLAAAN